MLGTDMHGYGVSGLLGSSSRNCLERGRIKKVQLRKTWL